MTNTLTRLPEPQGQISVVVAPNSPPVKDTDELVGVIVTIFEAQSYDDLFRVLPQIPGTDVFNCIL